MIRFKVFQNGKVADSFHLHGAHLFGQDEIPVRSQLDFNDGEILGLRHSDTAVGLVTLWDIAGSGKVLLQTTRLPERNESYNLNVELARGRLLRISQKREEWGMMDLKLSEKQHEMLDNALDCFIESLSNLDDPEKAAKAADESLSWSARSGEEMSLAFASLGLERRMESKGISSHCFGCTVDPSRINDKKYLNYIKEHFSYVTLPISWRQIMAKENERDFDLTDEWINWLSSNRIAIKVGPLIYFSPAAVPDWLYIWENEFDQVRDMAYDFVTSVVGRYAGKVHAWDVVSSLNVENCFKFSFEQIIEISRSSVVAARHAAPRSMLLVEVSEPWGDYYAFNQRTIPPFIYIDMICQTGVNFNAVGVKLRFGRGGAGMITRDLLELSAMLDRLGVFGKSLHLTGVQVPSEPDPRDNNGRLGEAGHWRKPWSEDIQARWLDKAYRIALGRSYVETVTWKDLVDREDGVLMRGGLLKKDLSPKPAMKKLISLEKELIKNSKKHKNNVSMS